ncbi:MAG: tetratricopeptide repeat protein, partial [Candidatus Omnitrophica bacterium]|nr:tetratricopeptide repeat protein [Candidatus Omnitrophota bacterium]
MRHKYKGIFFVLTVNLSLIVFTFFSVLAVQENKVSQKLERGIGQYKHENYEEALATLKEAKKENPDSSLASYYLGMTYKQMQDYKSAIPELKDAVTFSPKIKGALIELIDCLYQLNRIDEAKEWISEAELEGIRPAQVAFFKGLIEMKDNKTKEAVESFKNAKALDPSMSQTCDYQIAMAHLKMKRYGDAKRAFTEVTLKDPNSNMANFANQYADVLARQEEAAKPFRFSFGAAWQYDDNVILKPDDTSIAADISDKGDSRQVYTASAEYNHMFGDKFGTRALYSFYYAKQSDLGFYDMVTNSIIGQPTIYFENALLTFPSGFIHNIVNDKAYQATGTTSGILNFNVGKTNMGQAFMRYQNKTYFWDPSTADENRDANDLAGGCAWYVFFAENKGFFNVRYEMNKETTR